MALGRTLLGGAGRAERRHRRGRGRHRPGPAGVRHPRPAGRLAERGQGPDPGGRPELRHPAEPPQDHGQPVPASLPKRGSASTWPSPWRSLLAAGDVRSTGPDVFIAELGLDGRLRPVRGVLPAVMAAVRAGFAGRRRGAGQRRRGRAGAGRGGAAATRPWPGWRSTSAPIRRTWRWTSSPAEDANRTPSRSAAAGRRRTWATSPVSPRPAGAGGRGGRRAPPAVDGPAGGRQDHAGRAAARPAAGPGRCRGAGGHGHPLAVRLASASRQLVRRPPYREPPPHAPRRRPSSAAAPACRARGGLPGPPGRAVPRRGAGVRRRVLDACASPWSPVNWSLHRSAGQRPFRPGSSWCWRPTRVRAGSRRRGRRLYLHADHAPAVPGGLSGPLLDRIDIQLQVDRVSLADFGQPAGEEATPPIAVRVAGRTGAPAVTAAAVRPGNHRRGARPAPPRAISGLAPRPRGSWTMPWNAGP